MYGIVVTCVKGFGKFCARLFPGDTRFPDSSIAVAGLIVKTSSLVPKIAELDSLLI